MNDNYRNDVWNSLKYCRMLLRPLGVWPLIYGFNSKLDKIISMILIVSCFLSELFVLLPGGYYCFFYVKDVNIKIKTFGPIFYCMACIFKYSCLTLRASTFKRCIKHIEKDWMSIEDPEHRAIMIHNAMVIQKLTIAFAVLIYASALSYHTILPVFSDSLHTEANRTVHALAVPGYELFVDAYASPTYEIISIILGIYSFFCNSITAASCSLVAYFVAHACGMLQIQMARLEYLVTKDREKSDKDKTLLAVIINGHVDALTYSKRISTALQELCFLEVMASTLLMCSCEYQSLAGWKSHDMVLMGTYTGFMLSFTFNILVLCHAGELLVEEAEKFSTATYNIEWYNLPGNQALDLVMLISIARYPPKLTGGKVFEISMNTFSTVLKSSVVYLNLCRAVSEW
ncbi:Odorant receptor 4 [Anthophora retusa]